MTKEKLESYQELEEEIRDISWRIQRISDKIASMNQLISDEPSSPKKKELADHVAELVDEKEMYKTKRQKLHHTKKEIEGAIDKLTNSLQRRVVRYKYIDGMPWYDICLEIKFGKSEYYRVLNRALQVLLSG